ncbi:ethylbenzene dehydrogenase-related protein [Thioalkalivibrio sp. ALJ2]|uniref:ethylbenzene dehydrogenase-related protein n=1 Tax=Thioalkalivibrio sp. ALJ2 TaxID=1261622 RepID=UPI0003701DC4|nr:ethylbenzene dehydrogenase-related protein [Thioalkalivibrio sp. ALJ2]
MKRRLLALLIAATGPTLVLADEPRKSDPDQNVYIPGAEDSQGVLRVAAVYNGDRIRIHYEYETNSPSWYHQYWRYEDGEWVRYGSGGPEPDEHGLYEDRISMMLDDGSVDDFMRLGGWMTAHEGMRSLSSEVDRDDVREHPKLGEAMGRSDVRKYLPQTRETDDPEDVSWDAIRDDDELEAMRENGEFLDLWQWRAHRSHPMGYADNGYVLHYRLASEGDSMFTTNWDDDTEQPAYMFDPDQVGAPALDWERLVAGEYGQNDPYFLSENNSVAFDPDYDWQEGDTLPQRFLREPGGSRGAIEATGGYQDGAWRIALTRSLDAPNSRDSKALEQGNTYNVAFAVHNGTGARWHLVSLPLTLGLDNGEADIEAQYTDGHLDDADLEWTEVPVFYPGQMTYQKLHSDAHGAGGPLVRDGDLGVLDAHDPEGLADLIIEHELRQLEN